jgi:hypothetical protein
MLPVLTHRTLRSNGLRSPAGRRTPSGRTNRGDEAGLWIAYIPREELEELTFLRDGMRTSRGNVLAVANAANAPSADEIS